MEPFPFSRQEWDEVADAALPVVNAGLMDDNVVRASHLVDLLDVLARLRERYGDHPILLETEADFVEETGERVALYRRALEAAVASGLLTFTIRISLAEVLFKDLGRPAEARAELTACEDEVNEFGDDSEREHWGELAVQCDEADRNPSAA